MTDQPTPDAVISVPGWVSEDDAESIRKAASQVRDVAYDRGHADGAAVERGRLVALAQSWAFAAATGSDSRSSIVSGVLYDFAAHIESETGAST